MPAVVRLYLYYIFITQHLSVSDEWSSCSSFSSLQIIDVWSLKLQVWVWALTPSSMPPLGWWASRPGQTWRVDWGDVGGRLGYILLGNSNRAHSHMVWLLGHGQLGRPLCCLVLPHMSLYGFGVSLMLPWLSWCVGCGAPETSGVRPSRRAASASLACWTVWIRSRPESLLSAMAGGVSCGLVCA